MAARYSSITHHAVRTLKRRGFGNGRTAIAPHGRANERVDLSDRVDVVVVLAINWRTIFGGLGAVSWHDDTLTIVTITTHD